MDIKDLVEKNEIEKWIAVHEFGHLFTSVLFKKIGLQYNTPARLQLAHSSKLNSKLKSSPKHKWFEWTDSKYAPKQNVDLTDKDLELFYPIIFGFCGGDVFECVFMTQYTFPEIIHIATRTKGDYSFAEQVRNLLQIDWQEDIENKMISYYEVILKHQLSIQQIFDNVFYPFSITPKADCAVIENNELEFLSQKIENNISIELIEDITTLDLSFPTRAKFFKQ